MANGAAVTRSAESWQFFAFMFAAILTVAFALIEEIDEKHYRIALKLFSFVAIAYLTLWNRWSRNLQVRFLNHWKTERY
jgi:hypothetical protein